MTCVHLVSLGGGELLLQGEGAEGGSLVSWLQTAEAKSDLQAIRAVIRNAWSHHQASQSWQQEESWWNVGPSSTEASGQSDKEVWAEAAAATGVPRPPSSSMPQCPPAAEPRPGPDCMERRIARASAAGVQARKVLNGERSVPLATPWVAGVPSNRYWAVVRARKGMPLEPKVFRSWKECKPFVYNPGEERLAEGVLLHGFASVGEVSAYLGNARLHYVGDI